VVRVGFGKDIHSLSTVCSLGHALDGKLITFGLAILSKGNREECVDSCIRREREEQLRLIS